MEFFANLYVIYGVMIVSFLIIILTARRQHSIWVAMLNGIGDQVDGVYVSIKYGRTAFEDSINARIKELRDEDWVGEYPVKREDKFVWFGFKKDQIEDEVENRVKISGTWYHHVNIIVYDEFLFRKEKLVIEGRLENLSE